MCIWWPLNFPQFTTFQSRLFLFLFPHPSLNFKLCKIPSSPTSKTHIAIAKLEMGFQKEEKSVRILRALKTLFFLITMFMSLLFFSAPILLAIADALLPSLLLSALLFPDSLSFKSLSSHLQTYDFGSSLVDIPLISISRSAIIICKPFLLQTHTHEIEVVFMDMGFVLFCRFLQFVRWAEAISRAILSGGNGLFFDISGFCFGESLVHVWWDEDWASRGHGNGSVWLLSGFGCRPHRCGLQNQLPTKKEASGFPNRHWSCKNFHLLLPISSNFQVK